MTTVGFYYNCYKNRYATENILKQLRNVYKDEPVYLLNDNGDDFSDIAQKYNCFYKHSQIRILGGRTINGRFINHVFSDESCAKLFLKEISNAIDYCQTDYIVLMEDDVFINHKIKYFPLHSGGDTNVNFFQNIVDFEEIKKYYPKICFNYWNLAGGSILHSKTILECIHDTPLEEISKFDYLCNYLKLWGENDIILSYLLIINGKTNDKWTNTESSGISHPDKRFYKQLDHELGIYRT